MLPVCPRFLCRNCKSVSHNISRALVFSPLSFSPPVPRPLISPSLSQGWREGTGRQTSAYLALPSGRVLLSRRRAPLLVSLVSLCFFYSSCRPLLDQPWGRQGMRVRIVRCGRAFDRPMASGGARHAPRCGRRCRWRQGSEPVSLPSGRRESTPMWAMSSYSVKVGRHGVRRQSHWMDTSYVDLTNLTALPRIVVNVGC